jgi:formamidopyrimidine-DNA glycosylase
MPELPDVEVLKRYLDATALHQKIEKVEVNSDQVLKGISSRKIDHELKGHAFESTRRHGKFMFVEIDAGGWLVLHFGMTGDLKYYKREDKRPEYVLVDFNFENGYHLAYVMTRKLGEVRIIRDVRKFIEARELGPDVMGDDFTFEQFEKLLAGRHGMVKPTLMNQGIMAGIGNVYSDEILFQARIHPETSVDVLGEEDLKNIYQKMNYVLKTAIEQQAIPDRYPDSFITKHRDQGEKCPNCNGKVERLRVSGRSAYYCSSCQGR